MFIRPQNIQSLNNPVHLAILLILLVQTINKNFTHPFPSVNPPTYCISFNLVIDRFLFSILVEFCQWCVKFLSHLFTGPRKLHFFYIVGRDQRSAFGTLRGLCLLTVRTRIFSFGIFRIRIFSSICTLFIRI